MSDYLKYIPDEAIKEGGNDNKTEDNIKLPPAKVEAPAKKPFLLEHERDEKFAEFLNLSKELQKKEDELRRAVEQVKSWGIFNRSLEDDLASQQSALATDKSNLKEMGLIKRTVSDRGLAKNLKDNIKNTEEKIASLLEQIKNAPPAEIRKAADQQKQRERDIRVQRLPIEIDEIKKKIAEINEELR